MFAVWYTFVIGLTVACGFETVIYSRTHDRGVHVDISGLHPNHQGNSTLSLTLTSCKGYTATVKPVTGDRLHLDVDSFTCRDDNSVDYVIEYRSPNDVTVKSGVLKVAGESNKAPQEPLGLYSPVAHQAVRKMVTVLYDDFSSRRLDPTKWNVAATADGGGGDEFNMYTPEPVNSYIKNRTLFIRPTFTVNTFGKDFLQNGTLNITAKWGRCTDQQRQGCYRKGWNSIPPIMSAYLSSRAHIRYGKVEVVAKLPHGDWLWPAIWMLPTESYYGTWPRSGEIDIMESRGNSHYYAPGGRSIGNNVEFDTIHYGPAWNDRKSHGRSQTLKGSSYADHFHLYWFDWTEDYMKMGVDNITVFFMPTPPEGFWKEGGFEGPDIWAKGSKNAPFDRPFYLILNVAVGGRFFKEIYKNAPYPQPWADNTGDEKMQFWSKRALWQQTWQGDNSAMQIKSVKMMQYLNGLT